MIQPFWRYCSKSYSLCPSLLIPASRGLLRDCKISYNSWEPLFEALYLYSRPGWGHGARRRHTTSVILPSTVSWQAEHRALSHCRVSLHHRDMGARYLHRISTVSTQGTGWPDASLHSRIINWQKSGWMDQCQVQGGAIGFH